jgi:S-DNA-T family DNA segregation ATPase FtsK/SpoIIIE
MSIIFSRSANEVNLILFDVGGYKLSIFNEVPHLTYPVVNDVDTAVSVFTALVVEMERRLALQNNHLEFNKLPYIVCVIDEGVSLILNADRKQSEILINAISNLLRRGRQAKIVVAIATQDPTLKNIKFDLKNITSRIVFRCAKYQDSLTMLGEVGAEKLMGNGQMLFKSNNSALQWVQGAYITPEEITAILNSHKFNCDCEQKFQITQSDLEQIQKDLKKSNNRPERVSWATPDRYNDAFDELFAEFIMWTLSNDMISTLAAKDKFNLGHPKARSLVAEVDKLNLVKPAQGNTARKVLPMSIEDCRDMTEVMEILERNGYSEDDIIEAISQRQSNRKLLDSDKVR